MRMKFWVAAVAALLLAMLMVSNASASLAQFSGNWVNADPAGGITKLKVTVTGPNAKVQAWGSCTPTDCDWGEVKATAFATSVSASIASDARYLMAVFTESFKKTTMTMTPSGNRLKVTYLTQFTDNSGRTSYGSEETFKRP
jgi:hypothetical protein